METTASAADSNKSNASSGFGDKIESRTCGVCYVDNTAADKNCLCIYNKNGIAPAESVAVKPTPQPSFDFGTLNTVAKPVSENKTTIATTKSGKPSLAEQFKPKPGVWSCKACYTSNVADTLYCACCEEPKDDTFPKKGQANNLFTPSKVVCPSCNDSFKNTYSSKRHINRLHQSNAEELINGLPTPESQELPCKFYEETFFNEWSLTRHVQRLHKTKSIRHKTKSTR